MTEQRKKLIVNRDLQLREAAASAAIVIISINLLLILGTLAPELIRISVTLPASGYLLVALIEFVLLAIVVVHSIRRSHRIAGPLYAIARDLKRVGEGDLTAQLKLRPRDEFVGEAKIINEAIQSLRVRVQAIKTSVSKLVDAQEPSDRDRLAESLTNELKQLQTEKPNGNEIGSLAQSATTRQGGFTIIELMVVVAIVSILAIVALPAYQDYAVRAKVSEVLARGAAVRTSISEWYASNGARFPAFADSAPFKTGPSGKVRSALWDPAGPQIVLTISTTGTDPLIYGDTVLMRVVSTASRVVQWKCEPGTILQKYLPSSCK